MSTHAAQWREKWEAHGVTHRDLQAMIRAAVKQLAQEPLAQEPLTRGTSETIDLDFWVRRARVGHGDWASNVALVGAKDLKMAPRELARALIAHLSQWPGRVEEANGFLNFAMDDDFLKSQIARALDEGAAWGAGQSMAGRVAIEFVSAEPSGPLPFSLARIAAMGDVLCRLLALQGASVTREFFINDALSGSQTRLLGESISALYLAHFGHQAEPPEGALDDAFVRGVARDIVAADGNAWVLMPEAERALEFARRGVKAAVAMQKQTLGAFNVQFDVWTSEQALRDEGHVEATVAKLRERGHTFERDGALWLRTTQWGDTADRPLLRPAPDSPDGKPTYLATDIAYHLSKLERGFERLINIWTAEHRTYVARTRAALQAAGTDADKLEVLPCEGARWLRDGAPVRRGKNSDTWTLDDALIETDRDTLRFWLLLRDWNQVATLESETVRRDDETNAAYAARLLPSRLDTLIRETQAHLDAAKSNENKSEIDGDAATANVAWSDEERELARLVALWPDTALTAALEREPPRVARFVSELAASVRALLAASRPADANHADANHAFDEARKAPMQTARLQLLRAAQITANNALRVLGMTIGARV